MSTRGTGPKARPAPGGATARRTPFVLLVVVLLGSGLIALLLLNSSLNQGSFDLSKLEKQTKELTDERQALQQDVDKLSAPAALERRARALGMVPGGSPVFLGPDGKVSGVPAPATGQPSVLGAPGRVLPSALGRTRPGASPGASASPSPSGASPVPSVLAPAVPTAISSGAGAGAASATASATPRGLFTAPSAAPKSTPAPQ
ncbi:septum formation initiator family protein [Streptomyces hygroscopicus subsp. hygroscopicus]|uniref:FtsB family cell division protein n=1 Tax=Streptomyces sp. SRF1 TaxID=1549642 RepID=UPI001C655BCE|nr:MULTISPECIES: septum formation initiator family protein [Streptomyces]MBW8090563.1 septum formation initiator family protein [Streptomyces hygroscopicus subsp. hygroscopicus]MDN3057691.1 septum formation initiator family protein [Streptomyces sp. SRF1]